MSSLKLVAFGCLHGNLPNRVVRLIKEEKPDAVLISGDFSGGDFADELRKYESKLVEKFGVISELWPIKVQIESEKKFRKWAHLSAQNTEKIFENLKKIDVPVFYVHGNWDLVSMGIKRRYFEGSGEFFVDEASGKNMFFIHGKVVKVNGYSIAGFGGYRGTSAKEYLYKDLPQPWPERSYLLKVKGEFSSEMERVFSLVKDKRKMILLTHDPPYKTFDYLKSARKFYGEKITRDMISLHKPLACICSHFHEHRGVKKIGSTFVIATGFGHNGQASIVNIDGSRVDVKLVGS